MNKTDARKSLYAKEVKRIPFAAATPYPSIGAMEFGEYTPENFLNETCYRLSFFLEDKGYLSGATPSRRAITNFRVDENAHKVIDPALLENPENGKRLEHRDYFRQHQGAGP